MLGRQKVSVIVAEFVGTYVLATAMLSTIVRTNFAFFAAIAAGLVYAVMMLVLGSTSGSHLNPAVSIGLWTLRKISTLRAIIDIIAQMLGGLVAWKVTEYFVNQPLTKLASGGINWRVLVAEGVGTLVFTFGLAAAKLKETDNGRRAVIAGASLFAGIAVASLAANGLLNPAVALAAQSWSWGYVVGPIVGAIVGMNLYVLFFGTATTKTKATAAASVKPKSKSKK